jgi:hypothetical protein
VLNLAGLGRLLVFRLLGSGMLASLREKSSRVKGKDRSSFSVDGDSYCKNGNSVSIRQIVFEKLDENPSLTAKSLCKLLDLSYCSYSNYLARLKCEWKYYRKNERGSKCSVHARCCSCHISVRVEDGLVAQPSEAVVHMNRQVLQ